MEGERQPDWHLQEWMAHFGKRQASLTNELGWNKSKANFFWHGRQAYRRDVVNEIAKWLGIEPYELLMPPTEALALRRLRQAAAVIVNESVAVLGGESAPRPPTRHRSQRTGTQG